MLETPVPLGSAALMRKLGPLLPLSIAMALLPSPAQATLIGDTVDAGIFFDGVRYTGHGLDSPFVVQAGPADVGRYYDFFTLDVEASSLSITFLVGASDCGVNYCSSWSPGTEFRIWDLNFGPGLEILGMTVQTTMQGWANSRASFGADHASFDWQYLRFKAGSVFNVEFRTSPVPEPGAFALLAAGLLGLRVLLHRRGSPRC